MSFLTTYRRRAKFTLFHNSLIPFNPTQFGSAPLSSLIRSLLLFRVFAAVVFAITQLSCGFVISIFSWIFCCPFVFSVCLVCWLSVFLSFALFVHKKLPSVLCLSVCLSFCRSSFVLPSLPPLSSSLPLRGCCCCRWWRFCLVPRWLLASPLAFCLSFPLSSSIPARFWCTPLCSVSFSYCLIYFVGFIVVVTVVPCVCVRARLYMLCVFVFVNSSFRAVVAVPVAGGL